MGSKGPVPLFFKGALYFVIRNTLCNTIFSINGVMFSRNGVFSQKYCSRFWTSICDWSHSRLTFGHC